MPVKRAGKRVCEVGEYVESRADDVLYLQVGESKQPVRHDVCVDGQIRRVTTRAWTEQYGRWRSRRRGDAEDNDVDVEDERTEWSCVERGHGDRAATTFRDRTGSIFLWLS